MTAELPIRWRIRAGATAALVAPLLSLVSFARLSRWLTGRSRPEYSSPSFDDLAIAAWVDRLLYALPGPWHHTCLKRCAVLYYLFRRDGRRVELCIGVRRDAGGALAAHAWLLQDGRPYLERESYGASAYTLIARFPEPPRSTA